MADFQNVVRTDFFHGLFLLFRRRSSFFVRACRPLSCWSDFDSLSQRCSSVRNCIEQAAGVVFLRVEKDIVYTAGFHNRPMIHDDDPVTERTDDAEVV